MKDMTKSASRLDTFFKILGIMVSVVVVCQIVALCIISAAFLFDLPPEMVGTGWENLELGFFKLHLADAYVPDYHILLWRQAAEAALMLVCFLMAQRIVRCIRNILAPMKTGEPFHNTVSRNLKKLANLSCFLGIGLNLYTIIGRILTVKAYDLSGLLIGEKITAVDYSFTFDLSFLAVWGILLLLSYVFRCGEELQQLSDETL